MERRDYYKYLFFIGAIWNWLIGVIFIAASIFLTDLYAMFGAQEPLSLVWFHIFFIFVIIFGIGYFCVGQDIDKNHGIVKIGIIAKLSVVVVFFYYFLIGDFNILVMGPPIVDLIFVILFLEFLINYNK